MAARPIRTIEIAPSTPASYVAASTEWEGEEFALAAPIADDGLEEESDDEGVPYHLRPRAPLRRGGPRPELTLTPEEQLVAGPILRELFRDGCTLEQIGILLGLSRERIRQVETAAFRKLAAHPEAREIIESMPDLAHLHR